MENIKRGAIRCKNCGAEFEPTCHKTRQKFCSDACRHKYHNVKRRYDVETSVCPECGGEVAQSGERGQRRVFCSDQCRVEYHRKKQRERRRAKAEEREGATVICPNCGIEFKPEWGPGKQRRFCSDECRIEWWGAYHRAHPVEDEREACETCGAVLEGKKRGQKYCSRFCYLLAMDEGRIEKECAWCGAMITTRENAGRQYCSRECAVAGRHGLRGVRRGRRRINEEDVTEWHQRLVEESRKSKSGKRGKRVRLVCGTTSMYTGLDGLVAIIRYHLRCDPYDGSVYVFRDGTGSMLKYIEWDGQSFIQSKRRAQSGTYPWPRGEAGTVVELREAEFEYLLSRSIVPFKEKK